MKLKTVFNNILVKIIEDDSQIVISEEVQQPQLGEVVAIGSGTPTYPMQVRPTTPVYFNKNDAQKLEVDGETYYVLSQTDILAFKED